MSSTGFRGFEHTVQETNGWLHEIADQMGNPHRQMARTRVRHHALRGVLFALRDRLPVDEVFNLAAQLPMLIRGIYFEGYKVTGKPAKFHAEEFLACVHQELQKVGPAKPEKERRNKALAPYGTAFRPVTRPDMN